MPARNHTPSPPPANPRRGAAAAAAANHSNTVSDEPEDGGAGATETSALLASSSTSRPSTPRYSGTGSGKPGQHARKMSGAGSVAERRLGPAEQVARVSVKGQRRILTTPLLMTVFFILVILTFVDVVFTILLGLNTAYDLSSAFRFAPYRGSGFMEVWIALLGAWAGLGSILFFSTPVYLLFLTNALTTILLIPIFVLTFASPPLRRAHYPLLALPLGATALTFLFSLLASALVRRARAHEGARVVRMVAQRQADEAAHGHAHGTARERERRAEEEVARALVGLEGGRYWSRRVWGWTKAVVGFLGGLAGAALVVLLLANLCLTAYDNTLKPLHPESKLISVHPKGAAWSYKIHLICSDPPEKETLPDEDETTFAPNEEAEAAFAALNFPSDHRQPRRNQTHFPTIIYEAPSGVPGTIAHLTPARVPSSTNPFPIPRPPNNGTDISGSSPYPGSWILSLQKTHKVGRVCVWDRPGYGFSESGSVELGQVADALWEALGKAGEKGPYLLVGDGYGGLITRVFAARHPKSIHGLLHIDAQTAQTYFRFPPTYNLLTLTLHRFFTRLLPSLTSPLGLRRLYSLFANYDSAIARVMASSRPHPASTYLSEKLQKALLEETYLSHTHDSPSFRTLLRSQPPRYPADTPAIILSSDEKMQQDTAWAEGQRSLAEEVTSETGRRRWEVIKKTGHDLCAVDGGKKGDGRGRRECTRALVELVGL